MNTGLKILLLYGFIMGCASTPKPVAKKKAGTTTTKTVKGPAGAKAPVKAPVKAAPTPPPAEEEVATEEEEEDDQFSRIKKYYKK